MATIRVLKFSTKLNLAGAQSGLAEMESAVDGMSKGLGMKLDNLGGSSKGAALGLSSFAKFAAPAALAVGALEAALTATGAAFEFLKGGVSLASDLNETISKTDVVLGDSSGAVKAFADDMATRFGLVKGEVLDTAASMGGLGKSLGGLSGAGLSDFATQTTKMAADLASIQNLDLKTAADALRIGLSGNQSDKLKELGVITTEGAVKQKALAMGIAKVGEELSEQQKFMARSQLISEGLAFANGDLERTIGGTANASRKLTGTLKNFQAEVGATLEPAINKGIGLLNEFAAAGVKGFESFKPAIGNFTANLSAGLSEAMVLFRNFEDSAGIMYLKVQEKLHNLAAGFFNAFGGNAAKLDVSGAVEVLTQQMAQREAARPVAPKPLAKQVEEGTKVDPAAADTRSDLEKWAKSQLEGALSPLQEYSRDVGKIQQAMREGIIGLSDYAKLSKKLMEDSPLGKFAERFKESVMTPMEKYTETIGKLQDALAAGLISKEQFARGDQFAKKEAGIEPKKIEPMKFAGAAELGSKEAYSTILGADNFHGKGEPNKALEKINGDQLVELRNLNGNFQKLAGARSPAGMGMMA